MKHNPCTGGLQRFPVYDRNGRWICEGDKLRAQVCIGPYGQTKIVEVTAPAHWEYCAAGPVSAHYDHATKSLITKHRHVDYEHGHETWAEVIP